MGSQISALMDCDQCGTTWLAASVVFVLAYAYMKLKARNRFSPLNFKSVSSKKVAQDINSESDLEYIKTSSNILFPAVKKYEKKIDTYEGQSAILSEVLKKKIIDVNGLIRQNAQELFLLHRENGPMVEGGLGVRITVQLNLFGGSVANLGNEKHQKWLQGVFDRGELGCFLLTEAGAGVLSGLVVDTTATFDPKTKTFDLHSPTVKSRKTWISQGLTAKWGVVIARLFLPSGEDKGPHAFVVDMEAKGLVREDMPQKTDFNGLDNANVWFNHVKLKQDDMLTAISYVNDNGDYVLHDPKVPFRFVSVAQRLLSGRVCISGASICQLKKVLEPVKEYALGREIPTGADEFTPLGKIPVMADTLEQIEASMMVFRHFTRANEENFMADKILSKKLVDRIACGKAEVVQYCIDAILQLKTRVGSLSLQGYGPFGSQTDILYVYRFAEGDAAILQQKMARDLVKKVGTVPGLFKSIVNLPLQYFSNKNGLGVQRATLTLELLRLAVGMLPLSKKGKTKQWFASHAQIERIAHLHAMITMYDTVVNRPGLRGTRELELFKRLHMDTLI